MASTRQRGATQLQGRERVGVLPEQRVAKGPSETSAPDEGEGSALEDHRTR
jgi:hypothetical protein